MQGLMEVETPAKYSRDGEIIDELPADFYSSRSYADFLMEAVREGRGADRPFLAYLSFSSPHDPLHVPEPWLSKYRGQYDEGYEDLKQRRFEAAKSEGLIPENASLPPRHPMVSEWGSLSDEEKEYQARAMEVYAGMVDNMDYHLGRVLDILRDIGEYDNTVVVFMSDNGANPWFTDDYPGNRGSQFVADMDNRLENIGNPGSGVAYGIGWATASDGPYAYFKMTTAEGGIHTPLIVSGPGVEGPGRTASGFTYVMDLMPTILELTGIEHPTQFEGRDVEAMRGRSLAGLLRSDADAVYGPDDYMAGELGGGKWIRRGPYKAILIPPPYGPGEWQLFDLAVDPGETRDLGAEMPELLEEMIVAWDAYAADVGIVPME